MTEAAVQEVHQATAEAAHPATAGAVQADSLQAHHQREEVPAAIAEEEASAEAEAHAAAVAAAPEDRNSGLKLI
jgi:hypothetical protein